MTRTRRKPVLMPRRNEALQLDCGAIDYRPDYVGRAAAAQLLDYLASVIEWRQDDIMMFGRRVAQPRLTAWIADPGVTYRYSGLTLTPHPWPARLDTLRQRLGDELGQPFNSVLVNLYRDGNDTMGWHRDNETELGPEPVIASLSLGETRYFDLRRRDYREHGQPVQRFELHSGDLLVMRGAMQQHWQHRVPRQKTRTGRRINLSFRQTLRRG